MNSLNSVLIEGNLVRDPILAQTPTGSEVVNFSIASDRFYKKNDDWIKEVSFFDCEAWNGLGRRVADIKKGRGVRVVGRMKQDRWTDNDGDPHSRVKIVAEHVELRPTFAPPPNTAETEES